ncbi:MAG TPA: hypothetical protein VMV68_04710 [Spirochaetia bacterium]|nr:hypothetical protein [Spirochaetia bacterium]
MPAIDEVILDNISNEPALEGTNLGAEIKSGGFLKRRKVLRVYGTVHSDLQKVKAARIVEHAAGDNFDIVNDIVVK